MKRVWALVLVAGSGCAADYPPVTTVCGATRATTLLAEREAEGCRSGYLEAPDLPSKIAQPPEGNERERAWWHAGYARGWAHGRLRADVAHSHGVRNAGTVFYVLSGVGAAVAIVAAALLEAASSGEGCLDCFVLILAATFSGAEFAVGTALTVAGAVLQGNAERELKELDPPPGAIPLRPVAPKLEWHFRF